MNPSVRYPNVEGLFSEVDHFIPASSKERPPRIGISANRKEGLSCIAETYIQAVVHAGGAPVLIPVITDIALLTEIVESIDGLIMSGGADINPLFVNEDPIPQLQDVDTYRDEFDLILIRLAANRQVPMMGICRGHQVMNIAFGGSIYQDIYSQADGPLIKHSQKQAREYPSHQVTLSSGKNRLKEILDGTNELLVNSFHHQAVRAVAPGFESWAEAADGVNEAMGHPENALFSVQWHPEAMEETDPKMRALFRYHVENARLFARAKALHRSCVILDSHTDTPMLFPGEFNIGRKEGGKVNLPLMEEGLTDVAFMVAYIPQGARDPRSLQSATDYAVERLQQVIIQETKNSQRMGIARSVEDIRALKARGLKAIGLGVENGYAIGKDLANLSLFRKMGVSYITLCHNGDNDICDSAKGKCEWHGLSPFGREVVREMNRVGLLVDVSHASEETFYQVLETSAVPIVATHSSAKALCDHPRNLTDDQLKALAARGGVAQVCLYKGFINKQADKASLTDAVRHIDHMVEVMGIDHVGIGSDFDGDGELIGCAATNELINLTTRLLALGYSDHDIRKIWGENFLTVLSLAQDYGQKQTSI